MCPLYLSLSVRLSETIFPNFDKIAFTAPIMRCHIEIVIFIVGRLGKIYLLLSLFCDKMVTSG